MSTKYELIRPRAVILDCLRSEWPYLLSNYDTKATSATKGVDPLAWNPNVAEDNIHPAGVISLLRECDYNSPDLLAPLFYSLSTLASKFILPPTGHNISGINAADNEHLIIGIHMLRCLHVSSSQAPVHVVAVVRPQPDNDSHRSILCLYELLRYWHFIARPVLFDTMCDPILNWAIMIRVASASGIGENVGKAGEALCNNCKRAVLTYISVTRQKIWDLLPEVFGLV